MHQDPLIDAQELRGHVRRGTPDVVIFDCRFSLDDTSLGRKRYLEGHIPGARYAHLDDDLSGPVGPDTGRHPLPDPRRFADWLGHCGVSEQSLVVAYDDVGGMLAGRLWWMLHWIGQERAALLDGGLSAWQAAGGPLSNDVPEPEPLTLAPRVDDTLWLGTDAVTKALSSGTAVIVDARSAERFSGEKETLDAVAGHIPGALNLPCEANLDADGRFLPADQLRARFARAIGDHAGSAVVHSCGSGVTACHNLLAMSLAGLGMSRLYPGSWSEWIRSAHRPVATGTD